MPQMCSFLVAYLHLSADAEATHAPEDLQAKVISRTERWQGADRCHPKNGPGASPG